MSEKIMVVAGKRKSAIVKARISSGNGTITYNDRPMDSLQIFHKMALSEPISIAKHVLGNFPFTIKLTSSGGGKEGQIQAARLAMGKALVKFTGSADLKKALIKYDRSLLVADTRRKETYKPGDSKARAKRQKSYR